MAGKNGDRRQIMVPEAIWEKVTILAAADITSASAIVRNALKDYIAKRAAESRKAKRARQAEHTTG